MGGGHRPLGIASIVIQAEALGRVFFVTPEH
jgi:hypothetical protein